MPTAAYSSFVDDLITVRTQLTITPVSVESVSESSSLPLLTGTGFTHYGNYTGCIVWQFRSYCRHTTHTTITSEPLHMSSAYVGPNSQLPTSDAPAHVNEC